MKLMQAALILSSVFATSGALAETMIGVKVAQPLDNAINEGNDFEFVETPSFGGFYSNTTDNGMGVESEIMFNKSDFEYQNTKIGDFSSYTMGLYGNYTLPITPSIFTKAKVGYEYGSGTFDIDIDNQYDADTEESGFAAGVGVGMNITDKFGVIGEYVYSTAGLESSQIALSLYTKF